MNLYYQPPTVLLDTKKFNVLINKKLKPFPTGRVSGTIEVNNSYQADRQHNGKRWMTIVCKAVISSHIHNRDTLFTVERSLYFDSLADNEVSQNEILKEIKKVYGEINRVKHNHMDSKMFGGEISPPSDEILSEEIKSYLSALFFTADSAKIMAN